MQSHWFFEFSAGRVSGGESADVRVVLSCPEIIFFNFIVEVLAGEFEGVRYGLFFLIAEQLTEGVIGVAVYHVHSAGIIYELSY